MLKQDVIIIGAGAAGLAAARELSKLGKKVVLVEARDRIGGRIHTLSTGDFSVPVEAGAEFIHGDLPHTLELHHQSEIKYETMEGNTWQVAKGKLTQNESFIHDWPLLLDKLQTLTTDTTIAAFLDTYFSEEEYRELKESVIGFVEGYDAAETTKASAFALRDEWTSEDQSKQYRLQGGYSKLMEYLEKEIIQAGCSIYLSSPVREIHWKRGYVEVITRGGIKFVGQQCLITVPLGILQLEEDSEKGIDFIPPLKEKLNAARLIGFGGVVKIMLEFKIAFWEETANIDYTGRYMSALGFLFSDASIPTWWTQLPNRIPILTGWLAGPKAQKYAITPADTLLEDALTALASLFDTDKSFLQRQLVSGKVANWIADSYALGAYSYATVETQDAKKIVSMPVENTLFFAGEALYMGAAMGTVEAALASGIETAEAIYFASQAPHPSSDT